MRRRRHVPAGQDVVNAYGNTDEGDMSAGLDTARARRSRTTSARVEAAAMLRAWRRAGARMRRTPTLDSRWTRMCFCGQDTPAGRSPTTAAFGLSEFTGSEEGRGPLFDIDRTTFEGRPSPIAPATPGPQGRRPAATTTATLEPRRCRCSALRIGDRMIVSVPGEMTAEMGRRVRAAVLDAARGAGVDGASSRGLANEYASYFTTPEEYDRQHYEGGATVYGRPASSCCRTSLADLAGRLAAGKPAPGAVPVRPDATACSPTARAYPPAPRAARALAQPTGDAAPRPRRLPLAGRRRVATTGRSTSAFVTVQRRAGRLAAPSTPTSA